MSSWSPAEPLSKSDTEKEVRMSDTVKVNFWFHDGLLFRLTVSVSNCERARRDPHLGGLLTA